MSFNPVTMLIAATATKAVGSIIKGEGQAAAYEYNARVAQQNAIIAGQQGRAAEEAQQRDTVRKIGSMVAAYGASGVQTDSGSPMDVLADSARMAELDKLTLRYNYALKAAGYQSQAQLDLMGAQTSRTSGYLDAFASGTQGASIYAGNSPIPMFGQATQPVYSPAGSPSR